MATLRVQAYDDAGEALDAAREFLVSRPIDHNVLLTVLGDRIAAPEPGRYWVVSWERQVLGFALQSPPTFSAALAPASPDVVRALVETMSIDVPALPGVIGEATTVGAFAGAWTECRGAAGVPVEGGRIYRLGRPRPPEGVPGELRPAVREDREGLLPWAREFEAGTRSGPGNAEEVVDRRLADGRLFLWDHDEPVSMAVATAPVAGVSRIGLVFTPRQKRRRGFAAACVAALSQRVLDTEADTCILYTQLHNPTSNGVYRRIGYQAVAEVLSYRFEESAERGSDPVVDDAAHK